MATVSDGTITKFWDLPERVRKPEWHWPWSGRWGVGGDTPSSPPPGNHPWRALRRCLDVVASSEVALVQVPRFSRLSNRK